MAIRAPRVITEQWLWEWMIGRRPHMWILHIHNRVHEEVAAFPDREPMREACHIFMSQGYRITELEQRPADVDLTNITLGEHPARFIPNQVDIHIYMDPPSPPGRFYYATAAVPNEVMPTTEFRMDVEEFGRESDLQRQAYEQLLRSMALPNDIFTSGSFGPTAGSTFAITGRHGETVTIDEARRMFFDEDETRGRYQREMKERENTIKARQKALELFMECLTEAELKEFKSFSTVTIWSKLGVFRIDASSSGFEGNMPPTYNVYSGNEVYCVNVATDAPPVRNTDRPRPASINYPYYDHILAQMLVLKTDPERFLKTANKRGR